MSIFNDKALKSVAEAAAKIMGEQLKGNQHKIDANKNGKVDAHDFKLLRAGKKPDMKKEEVEQLDEVGDTPAGRKALSSYVSKALGDKNREKGLRKATSRLYKDNYYGKKTNEDVEVTEQEQLNEAFPTVADAKKRMDAGKTATGSVTKTATGLVHKRDYKDDDNDSDDKPKKSAGYGARQNYKRSTRVNEQLSFTEMLELYNEHGIKVLAPIEKEEMNIDGTTIEVIDADKVNGVVETTVEEEVTNDQFTKEFEDQKASFEGKKPQPKVAAGKTTGVKVMPEEYEQLDELSKDTLGSYVKKATTSVSANSYRSGYVKGSDTGHNLAVGKKGPQKDHSSDSSSALGTARKRQAGIGKAVERLTKEESELDERTLTKGEAKKKEDYVMGMKKGLSGFKQRYGERAKSVMYATATKMAKKD
jgi:hypothetical protein